MKMFLVIAGLIMTTGNLIATLILWLKLKKTQKSLENVPLIVKYQKTLDKFIANTR